MREIFDSNRQGINRFRTKTENLPARNPIPGRAPFTNRIMAGTGGPDRLLCLPAGGRETILFADYNPRITTR